MMMKLKNFIRTHNKNVICGRGRENVWIRDMGLAIKSACCGNDLPEKGMWSGKAGW